MRKTKWFASVAIAAGMLAAGTTAASAQDWRDMRHDANRAEWLRSMCAADRARLNDDMRYGNYYAVDRDRAILEQHESALRWQMRDMRRDWRESDRDYHDRDRGYYDGYRDYRR